MMMHDALLFIFDWIFGSGCVVWSAGLRISNLRKPNTGGWVLSECLQPTRFGKRRH